VTDTFFGDFDLEDAYDTAEPDPEQVARKVHRYRQLIERMAGRDLLDYDDLPLNERNDLEYVGARIVLFVAHHDPDEADELAEEIHETARSRRGGTDDWDDLSDELKRLARAFAALIAAWLERQGAWR
jgi:hypothetical protein